jgi:hypothetical protein
VLLIEVFELPNGCVLHVNVPHLGLDNLGVHDCQFLISMFMIGSF